MDLLKAIEVMVKNPLLDVSTLYDSIPDQNLLKSYKHSDTHVIRKCIANKKEFSDMSHVSSV